MDVTLVMSAAGTCSFNEFKNHVQVVMIVVIHDLKQLDDVRVPQIFQRSLEHQGKFLGNDLVGRETWATSSRRGTLAGGMRGTDGNPDMLSYTGGHPFLSSFLEHVRKIESIIKEGGTMHDVSDLQSSIS